MGGESSKAITNSRSKHLSRRLSACSSDVGMSNANEDTGNRCTASSNNISSLPSATSKCSVSNSFNEKLLGAGLSQPDVRLRSGSTISSPAKVKKSPIVLKNRQLIQSCFQNPHENMGKRILKRTAEKRKDFGRFYVALNYDQKDDIEDTIKTLLKKCVANIEFIDEVQRLASEFGGYFVKYRQVGFKADYFAAIGDATITECVFLDNAVHPTHQTLNAFSQFIAMLLTSVRDGFYNEMKRLRRTSNSLSTGSNGSCGNERKATLGSEDISPRSTSPAADSICNNIEADNEKQQQNENKIQAESNLNSQTLDEKENLERKICDKPKQSKEEQLMTESCSNCDTVVKQKHTVTFQHAQFDIAMPQKEKQLKISEENTSDESANTEKDDIFDSNNEEKDNLKDDEANNNIKEKRSENEDENVSITDSEPSIGKSTTGIISAVSTGPRTDDNNGKRKSLLPPSVAAILES